jgi:hypothetical protein
MPKSPMYYSSMKVLHSTQYQDQTGMSFLIKKNKYLPPNRFRV